MSAITTTQKPVSAKDRLLLEKLYDVINGDEPPVLLGREGAHIQVPEPVFHLLTKIVRDMLSGKTVTVVPANEELTTQAAANYLGVSRPHLVKLLESGEIPFFMVGTHRRVGLNDVRAYEKLRDAERKQSLNNLTKRIQAAELYDSDYAGDDD